MLLQDTSATQASIDNFIYTSESGGDTTLYYDLSGSGNAANVAFAVVENTTGMDVEDMVANGSIIQVTFV